jgi:enoyl-CoA hydratase/carnithine racemase
VTFDRPRATPSEAGGPASLAFGTMVGQVHDTEYETIRLERADGVATITLDRPERLNAFTEAMLEELVDAFDRTDADDGVRAVVVTGHGRAFCAGADLNSGPSTFERDAEPFSMGRHADGGGVLARRLFDSAKPIIGAINGPAVGIGVTMTLPMDVRLAAEHARFGFVFVKRGLAPEAASSFFLPRLVGISQAAEWVYTGRIFDAEEALAHGLVRSVHPPDELLPAARSLAMEMAAGTSPVATAIARRMLWQMLADGSPARAHEADSEALHFLGSSPDVREGVASFLEKREPAFPMRVSRDMPRFYGRWQAGRGGLRPPSGDGGRSYDRLPPVT